MEITILGLFCIGYLFIALEHVIKVNKAATALVTGVLCWTAYILYGDTEKVTHQLVEQLSEISRIIFFLMGAMTIVELIDSHDGFEIINKAITAKKRKTLLWIICMLTFLLSPVLDNLTTTIVMVSLCFKLVRNQQQRLIFIGMIVIAANAGGAWSPIGDVTTTMLWIGGQISATAIIGQLILPSIVSLVIPLSIASFMMKGSPENDNIPVAVNDKHLASITEQRLIFFSGLGVLLLVPVFKTLTHLPPFMGMMLGLGVLWIITEVMHKRKEEPERKKLSVSHALERMDASSILFFLGILLAVSVLVHTGQLAKLAALLSSTFQSEKMIVGLIGILSAIVDNVPIVAATMGMYTMETYPSDHSFWLLLAFCAGTGGSLLIIGSAAGVAAMGMEKISFGWYLKNVSWLALIGYLAGIATFIIQENIF